MLLREHDLSVVETNNPGFVQVVNRYGALVDVVKVVNLFAPNIEPADSFTANHNGPSVKLRLTRQYKDRGVKHHKYDLFQQSAGSHSLTSEISIKIRDYIGGLCEGLKTLTLVCRVGRWHYPDVSFYSN